MNLSKFFCLVVTLPFITACSNNEEKKQAQMSENESYNVSSSDDEAPGHNEAEVKVAISSTDFMLPKDAVDYMNSTPDSAAYAEGIIHQIAEDYLPYAEKLINNSHDRFIIVDKVTMTVRLYDRFGRLEKEYKTACAKNYGTKHQKGDSRTPEGFFSVKGIYDSTDWLFTDDNGYTSPVKGQFGPRFIRLNVPNTTQIGIHGTVAPWSLGRRVSHGCIRVSNENILELVELVDSGMPVIVNPSRKDTQTNISEGYDIPWISVTNEPRYTNPGPLPSPKPAEPELINDSAQEEANDSTLTVVLPEVEELNESENPVSQPDEVVDNKDIDVENLENE